MKWALGACLAAAVAVAATISIEPTRRRPSAAVPATARRVPGADEAALRVRLASTRVVSSEPADRSAFVPSAHATLATVEVVVACEALPGAPGDPVGTVVLRLRRGAREVASLVTDASGRARRSSLPGGRYSFEIDPASLPPGLLAAPSARTGTARTPFGLVPGRTATVRLAVRAASALSGEVRDADGRALASARVQLRSTALTADVPFRETETDESGAFSFERLLPGAYRCALVSADPHAIGGASPEPIPVTLGPGRRGFVVLLREGEGGVVCGRLVDEGGVPAEGLVVQAESLPRGEGDRAAPWSRVLARTRTGLDGRFRLVGLPRTVLDLRAAPRLGSSRGFVPTRPPFEESLIGREDLRRRGAAIDMGTRVLLRR